jgi:hypothetical protein
VRAFSFHPLELARQRQEKKKRTAAQSAAGGFFGSRISLCRSSALALNPENRFLSRQKATLTVKKEKAPQGRFFISMRDHISLLNQSSLQ